MRRALLSWIRGVVIAMLFVGFGTAAMYWYLQPMTAFLLADAWLMCVGIK